MPRLRRSTLPTACLALFFAAGCSSGSSHADTSPDDGDSGSTTPPDSGAGATLELQVVDVTSAPLAGAQVAVDRPDGTRAEGTSDAQGHVSVDGIDWTQGPVNITGYASGHMAISSLGITQAASLVVMLPATGAGPQVAITGALTGKAQSTDYATLTTTVPSTYYQGAAATYSLSVAPGTPYSIIGLDWTTGGSFGTTIEQTFNKWVKLDEPATTSAATVAVDFGSATALTPVIVAGQMTLPGGPKGPLAGATAYFSVTTVESGFTAFLGAPETIGPTPDATAFQWEGQYVALPGVTPSTGYAISLRDGTVVGANVSGYPSNGEDLTDLPVPPVLAASAAVRSLGMPIGFSSGMPQRIWTSLQIASSTDGLVWAVYATPAATSIQAPALPTGVDAATLIGSAPTASMVQCADYIVGDGCGRYAYSASFGVTP